MNFLIDEKHLDVLIRHGRMALEQARLMAQNPLFRPGALSFAEELTEALAAAESAMPPMDALDFFVLKQANVTGREDTIKFLKKYHAHFRDIPKPATEGSTTP